jgi:F-type H+-transporting ATPase subunit delta
MLVEKYVKALLSSLQSDDEIVKVYEAMARLSLVAKDPKFILIIKSPILSVDEKINIIKELAECENPKFVNFMKILLENKRTDLLKEIYKALYAAVSNYFNTYAGKVEGDISEKTLKSLEEKLSQKFNASIKLELEKKDINGIKVFVDVLNVEASIDENKIKDDIISNILKAI